MKSFLIFVIFAFQVINGNESVLNDAIKNALEAIEEQQDSLKNDFPILEQVISTATENANKKLTEELNQISKDFKDQVQIKAVEAFKEAYNKLITESKDSAGKILDVLPKYIEEYYVPTELAELAFTKIEKEIAGLQIEASGNSCKEKLVECLIKNGAQSVDETKECLLAGASSFPTIPGGIRYIRDEISKFTRKTIGFLKRCQNEDGAKCIEDVTSKVTTQAEIIKKHGEDFGKSKQNVLDVQKESIKRCVLRKLHSFNCDVSKASRKMRWC